MNNFKKIFKNIFSRIWFIVTASVFVLLIVANAVCFTALSGTFDIMFGGKRSVTADGTEPLYAPETSSKEEALEKANKLNVEINKEGIVLLKNQNALPLSKGSKISVFGKNSVNLVYGGSGSGGIDDISKAKTIYESLDEAGFKCNTALRDFYNDNSKSGAARNGNPKIENDGNVKLSTAETPRSKYSKVRGSYANFNDAALVVFSRIGGEGFDLPQTMTGAEGARNADDHYLQLDANETDLLKEVCEGGFKHIIVLINSSTPMELGFLDDPEHYAYNEKIDACLWIGSPGMTGIMALGSILNGETNPSGRLVDTYARDFKANPSWVNFGNYNYTLDGKAKLNSFVEYEEGIYVGYRYYETRGFTDGEEWYKKNVVYPFGYGLSYTTFDWEIMNKSELDGSAITKDEKIKVSVKVTNSGEAAGKDVVEIYATPQYYEGGIEKSHKVLAGFAKTPLLEKGAECTVDIEIDPYYIASYDYTAISGTAGYILEHGDYVFSVSKNAHEEVDTFTCGVAEDIRYTDGVTEGTKVTNRFDDADDELETVLSRTDWVGTWPKAPTEQEKAKTKKWLDSYKDFSINNPNVSSMTTMPMQAASAPAKEDIEITLRDMIGKDYDDPDWDKLLNQITVDDMINMYDNGAFNTAAIVYIGKAKTTDADGPVGFHNFMGDPTVYDTCSYASECVLGATWNKDLVYEMGQSIGEEGLWGNVKGDGMPYSGWYAPGVNIHRSPFGGRNFEYFSEDGFLTGELAASEIKGAMSKGVYCYVKHFALNDQETNRSGYGLYTWATEQSMREIYFRPFEKAVKDGKTTAIMSSFNRIGTIWTGGDYRLLTEVLRNEWGFRGTVICDFNLETYMNSKQMAYAGGDLNLTNFPISWTDKSNAADVTVLRQNCKNILYMVANSNAMNGDIIGYNLPYWQIALIIIDCVAVVGCAVWGIFAVRKALKKEDGVEFSENTD